jgi:adenylate cyclase
MRWLEQLGHGLICLIFAGYTLTLWPLPWVQSFEQVLDDARVNWALEDTIDSRIVVIDIDEPSLAEIGQWPWSRQVLADLFDELFDYYQINTLGLDFVIAEPTSSRERYLQALIDRGQVTLNQPLDVIAEFSPEDEALALALQNRNIVAGMVFKQQSVQNLNALPAPMMTVERDVADRLSMFSPGSYTSNIGLVTENARQVGFFDNPLVDSDGVYRRAVLMQRVGGNIYPSLALSVARLALSNDTLAPIFIEPTLLNEQLSIDYVQLGRYVFNTSERASVRVPYHHADQGYVYLSAADVLNNRIPKNLLADKIVLMGTTAPGLKDIRNTPVNSQLAGVEVHANIISGILDNNIPYQPSWRLTIELVTILVTAIVLWLVYRRRSPMLSVTVTLCWTGSVTAVNLWFWQQGILLSLAPFLMAVVLLYGLNSSWEMFVENYNKRRITKLFGQYVPPDIVNDLAEYSPTNLLEGTEQNLTVLFSDVRGFTTMSENLKPDELSQLMNMLLTPLTEAVHSTRGTIDKYMGDAIMAFWGAPITQENHAHLAVQTALAMQAVLQTIQPKLSAYNVEELAMGIGINSGDMCVGNMGSEFRMAYTVMGDAVNLGARLEALTRQYGVDILVSEQTTRAAPEFFYLPVDLVRVKGKTQPVAIYTPLKEMSDRNESDEQLLGHIKSAIEHYKQQEWPEASEAFEYIKTKPVVSTIATLYLARISALREMDLPKDWDGVYTHTQKS